MGDDGVGIRAVQAVGARLPPNDGVTIKETAAAGLNLLDEITGYDRLIVADAILAGDENVGKLFRLNPSAPSQLSSSVAAHSCGLGTVLELGRHLYPGQMPGEVIIIATGIRPVETVTETLSPAVEEALKEMVDRVIDELMQGA